MRVVIVDDVVVVVLVRVGAAVRHG